MAEHITTIKIPQFDGTNFNNWKYRVGILLDERGLRRYIEENLDDILTSVEAEQRGGIILEEKKCISILVQTIHDGQLEYVKEKRTAKEMFDTLCGIFERKSIASQLLLRRQLLMMKYDESDSITDYFLRFDTMIRELKSTGAKMEELDIVVHLLLTLPKGYDNLVTALETIDQEKLTLEFVKTRLMDEHNKRTGGNVPSRSSESGAMNAKGKGKRVICYGCGKVGHIKAKCKAMKKDHKSKGDRKDPDSATKASEEKHETMCAVRNEEANACDNKQTKDNTNAKTQVQRSNNPSQIKFVLDSGATQHMVNDNRYFDRLEDIDEVQISVAKKNQKISARQRGEILVKTFHDGDSSVKTIQDVLLVKDLKCNLMSIRSLTKKGYRIAFEGDYAYASINGQTKFVAHTNGKLYEVVLHVDKNVFAGISGESNMHKISQVLWHFRLGHLNTFDMKRLINHQMADGIKLDVDVESRFCEPCVMGKQTRSSFPKNKDTRSSRILELIHSDVCGPMPTTAHDGSRYFVSFVDDFSRASKIYCIQRKSEVLEKFKDFVAMVEALHGKKIAKLKADNGGEYTSNEFKQFCKVKGIQMMFTVPYNPEMNSVAERLNRTLQEKATTMLLASGLEPKFWNEAIIAANYIKNRSPTSAVGKQFNYKTPAEIWFQKKPDLSHLRIFGSECYNHIPRNSRSKLEAKSTKCIMLGYAASMGSYRLWDVEHGKVIIGRNVTFNEDSILNRMKLVEISDSEAARTPNKATRNKETIDTSDTSVDKLDSSYEDAEENLKDQDTNEDSIEDSVETTLRKSERIRRAPDRYGEWETNEVHYALSAEQFVEDDPLTIEEARRRDDWPEWKKAIEDEYQSLIKNNTWTLYDLPKDRKEVTNKWVFKLKRKADGEIDKYKARLVVRGFSQRIGFDYNETYAPVAKLVTLRILLAIANRMDFHIHQMDVKSAFLNGKLSEEIYMQQPDGFVNGTKVCKLNKALYGLKQASRVWNDRFNEFMIRIGFARCEADQCLYITVKKEVTCYVLLYVDDLLLLCKDVNMINTVKQLLSREFEMTDVGEANKFLGMYIKQDIKNGTISLNQSQYLENVLRKFDMKNCKSKTTPMEKGLHLKKGDASNGSKQPYRELIGCLTYATITTRPDLCAATGYFSRFQSCFDETHYAHAKHILRYIHGTTDLKLLYQKQESAAVLVGYADADWGGDKNDGKSTSGYVFKVFGNTVSWASRKQGTVSLSSTEAEYVALTEAICEAKWIHKLLNELGINCNGPISIFEDNQSCIRIVEESHELKRIKHINIKYNFIREAILNNEIKIEYISSNEQVADIMTKGLGRNLFLKHRNHLNLVRDII